MNFYVFELKTFCTSLPFTKPTATEWDPSQFELFKAVAFFYFQVRAVSRFKFKWFDGDLCPA